MSVKIVTNKLSSPLFVKCGTKNFSENLCFYWRLCCGLLSLAERGGSEIGTINSLSVIYPLSQPKFSIQNQNKYQENAVFPKGFWRAFL